MLKGVERSFLNETGVSIFFQNKKEISWEERSVERKVGYSRKFLFIYFFFFWIDVSPIAWNSRDVCMRETFARSTVREKLLPPLICGETRIRGGLIIFLAKT